MDELIAEAYARLDLEDSRDELIFRNWIYRALKWIGPSSPQIKPVCLEICDLSIKKPHDYWSAIDMNLLDSQGRIYYFQYTNNGFMRSEEGKNANGQFLGTDASLTGARTILVGEDYHCFNISDTGSEAPLAKAELKYYAMPKDKNGDPLIAEDSVEAVLAYVEWQYLKRGRNRTRGTRKFPHSEVETARMTWMNYKGMVQGNRKLPHPLAAEPMLRKWVTGIANWKNKARNSRISRFSTRHGY